MTKLLTTTILGLTLGLAACSTTPESSSTMAKSEASQMDKAAEAKMSEDKAKSDKSSKKDSKKGLSKSFSATPAQVKTATLVAMKKIGFKIKKESDTKIEGKRSNKVGLAVGSGGEKMYAEIMPGEGGITSVHVRTKKTFVGIVGQKNWDDEVLELISESLASADASMAGS